jgi:O-antigen ligase
MNSRFKCNLKTSFDLNNVNVEEIDVRFSLWKNAIYVWKEKQFFGHGIGDAKEQLMRIHKERNIESALENNLNSHNQFLETATQTGFVGLSLLLLVFAIPLYHSIRKKQELLFLFLMICFINFLFESMLQRLAGVVFFAFWYSFLYFIYYREKNDSN